MHTRTTTTEFHSRVAAITTVTLGLSLILLLLLGFKIEQQHGQLDALELQVNLLTCTAASAPAIAAGESVGACQQTTPHGWGNER